MYFQILLIRRFMPSVAYLVFITHYPTIELTGGGGGGLPGTGVGWSRTGVPIMVH